MALAQPAPYSNAAFVEYVKERIEAVRPKKPDISLGKVSEGAGLSRAYLSSLSKKSTMRPSPDTVRAIGESLTTFGATWDNAEAERLAGLPESEFVPETQRVDVFVAPTMFMRVPVYDAEEAAVHGASWRSIVGDLEIDDTMQAFHNVHRATDPVDVVIRSADLWAKKHGGQPLEIKDKHMVLARHNGKIQYGKAENMRKIDAEILGIVILLTRAEPDPYEVPIELGDDELGEAPPDLQE